jgi:hypothetical protein
MRRPDDFEKRPSILSDNMSSKSSSLNELSFVELGRDEKTLGNNSLLTTTTICESQHRNRTDMAMQQYLMDINYPVGNLKRYYVPVYEIPYSSMKRYQFVVCR